MVPIPDLGCNLSVSTIGWKVQGIWGEIVDEINKENINRKLVFSVFITHKF